MTKAMIIGGGIGGLTAALTLHRAGLAETLGSAAAISCVDPTTSYCGGLDVNANHVRSATSGVVTGTARPFHVGRTSHVWEIHVADDAERLICVARLTMMVVQKK